MRRVLKRFIKKDPYGRVLTATTERLVDDGNGRLCLATHNTITTCPGCGRPTDITDLRGRCQFCFANIVCLHCLSKCQLCGRILCPTCKRGFAGQSPITVCHYCLVKLKERQAFRDRLLAEKAAFERQVILQREWIRLLQSGALRRLPGGKTLTTLGRLRVMRKLKKLERSLRDGGYYNGRYLR